MTDKTVNATVLGDPLSYHNIMSQEDCDKWEEVCIAKLETFRKLGVFEEVPWPQDHKFVRSKE